MFDHITIGVADFERSSAFYDRALAPLGITQMFTVPKEYTDGASVIGYGDDRPRFWLTDDAPTNGTLHIAFTASSAAQVDAFYSAAIAAGGGDNGAPGLRPEYHASYYAAFIFDPDGHNIEAVCFVE